MIDLLMRAPETLEEIRWAKGLSATEAAKLIGISQTAMNEVEGRTTNLSLPIATKIAEFYQLTIPETYEIFLRDPYPFL